MIARFIVSLQEPYKILATEAGSECFILESTGWSAEEIRGQPVSAVIDSESSHIDLVDALQRTALLETTTVSVYFRKGPNRLIQKEITISPYQDKHALVLACLFFIKLRDKQIFTTLCGTTSAMLLVKPRALIAADWPHAVVKLSDGFGAHFDLPTLSTNDKFNLGGLATLLALDAATRAYFDQLVGIVRQTARPVNGVLLCGRAPPPVRGRTAFSDSGQQQRPVTLLPLLGPADRRAARVLVIFDPPYAYIALPGALTGCQACSAPVNMTATSTPSASPEATAPVGVYSAPTIFPRRKGGCRNRARDAAEAPEACEGGQDTEKIFSPVVVTPELVAGLRGMPVQQAADLLGVSATALKKACRKLGIAKWAYRKPPRSASAAAAAARSQQAVAHISARPPPAVSPPSGPFLTLSGGNGSVEASCAASPDEGCLLGPAGPALSPSATARVPEPSVFAVRSPSGPGGGAGVGWKRGRQVESGNDFEGESEEEEEEGADSTHLEQEVDLGCVDDEVGSGWEEASFLFAHAEACGGGGGGGGVRTGPSGSDLGEWTGIDPGRQAADLSDAADRLPLLETPHAALMPSDGKRAAEAPAAAGGVDDEEALVSLAFGGCSDLTAAAAAMGAEVTMAKAAAEEVAVDMPLLTVDNGVEEAGPAAARQASAAPALYAKAPPMYQGANSIRATGAAAATATAADEEEAAVDDSYLLFLKGPAEEETFAGGDPKF